MNQDRHLWEIRWVRDLALLAVMLLVMAAIYKARAVTVPIVVAVVLAYVFNPLVARAQSRWRIPRWGGAAIIMAVVVLVVTGFLLWAVPNLIEQVNNLIGRFPDYAKSIVNTLGLEIEDWDALIARIQEAASAKLAAGETASLGDYAGPVATALKHIYTVAFGLLGMVVSVITFLPVAVVITGFCFFFFTWHWAAIIGWFSQFIPRSGRDKTMDVLGKMDRSVSAFIRGRLIQGLVMGILLSVGWKLFGVPYWLLIGMGCGFLNLVPFLAVAGYLLALALSVMETVPPSGVGFTWAAVLWPTVVYVVAQAADGWIVEPIVQGKAANLDPLSVLLAVMIGGALAGLLGMVVAIPAAACVKILSQEVIVPRLRQYAEGDGGGLGAGG